ncbi:MAG TPA: endonuclease/exonuclease/phosphatase family protein [Candidatus Saccharimonadales bacterium]|nr:endonuclease/exonuclease/phosphatase family protein [Candidatus Saccharimonadales bacterium]
MAVEVMAWNVLDAFSDEQRARGVLKVVAEERRPDAALFSEAWREGKDGLLDKVFEDLDRNGYVVTHGLYQDNDGRQDRHGIVGIVRKERVADQRPQLISLSSRNAVHMPLVSADHGTETVVDFFGAHLDDRLEGRRLAQAVRLIRVAEFSSHALIGGDFNAMQRGDPSAKALRFVRPIARRMPTVEPRPDFKPPKLKRIGSLASRLTDMATGTTMQRFEEAGFRDTDPKNRPTKGPFMLDHIVTRGLEVIGQETHAKSPLSDHRAISALVRPI